MVMRDPVPNQRSRFHRNLNFTKRAARESQWRAYHGIPQPVGGAFVDPDNKKIGAAHGRPRLCFVWALFGA
jgi:tRNA(Arg) A34 adenosine deaminase TadA